MLSCLHCYLSDQARHLLVLQTLAGDDVFLALGRVEVDRQLNALGLVHTQRQIRLLLKVFQTETF